ncbi:hypothetical protein BGZ61DRAFT_172737 [Ilyonectria robusta]|uniref:uncharacterized protein n=1 Tax=Ilyonectria robusta TaxID=1079257 RepID=UPI001E8D8768|nr:uncharacterized protein BGZ61DRAFT_172737 [Ilyonectria robusta]KAH8659493.1 hypothetical protein BGZ61DRAFT_172737 [Ilyonectria robusta]
MANMAPKVSNAVVDPMLGYNRIISLSSAPSQTGYYRGYKFRLTKWVTITVIRTLQAPTRGWNLTRPRVTLTSLTLTPKGFLNAGHKSQTRQSHKLSTSLLKAVKWPCIAPPSLPTKTDNYGQETYGKSRKKNNAVNTLAKAGLCRLQKVRLG